MTAVAPELLALPGVGVETAGQLLVTAGDNRDRLRSAVSFVRRTAEGKTETEIMRCLKRYLAREIFPYLLTAASDARPEPVPGLAAKCE